MRINHNIAALNTYRQLNTASTAQSKSMEKLSSGLRINKAGDDAAGLAISEKMRSQVRGLDMASKNAQDGISLISTAEGALNETHDILQRMRELATQSANDTNTTDDRKEIQKEMNQLTSEINRIGNNTEFNTQKLLDGSKVGTGSPGGTTPASATPTQTNGTSGNITITDPTAFTGTAGTWTVATTDGTNFTLDKGTGASALTLTGGKATVDGIEIDVSGITAAANDEWEIIVAPSTTTPPSSGGAISLQIGANQSQQFSVEINDMRASALGVSGAASGTAAGVGTATGDDVVGASFTATGTENQLTDVSTSGTPEYALDLTDANKASAAIKVLDQAIASVSGERSKLGAYQNRLEHTINNLGTSSENLTAAESRIRDVDMAKEMMNQTKNSILSQAAQAMLAQANQQPQGVLQLLR